MSLEVQMLRYVTIKDKSSAIEYLTILAGHTYIMYM